MLDAFFISGGLPANTEKGIYVPFLVLASYVVASFGSYTGLTLAASMAEATKTRARNILHAGGAFALGSGIWSMHFIGMLSYKMKMAVSYDPLLTTASMLIAVVIAYGVLTIARSERLSPGKLVGGAILLGAAICGMHYTGMAAMQMDADLRYTPGLFFLSVAIAITASGTALWIIFSLGRHQKGGIRFVWRTLAALVMGAAICGMHYTGMAASVFIPFANCRHDPNQDFGALALTVTAITSIILGIALIFSLAVDNKAAARRKEDSPFPFKLLSLSSLLTLFAVLWASANSFYIDHRMTKDIRKDIEISQMGNQVAYLDTIIARSLRMLVTTGDLKWETTYRDYLLLSDDTIKDLETATSGEGAVSEDQRADVHQLAQSIDKSTDFFLGALENKAIDLAHEGKLDEARALLDGQEYTTRKQDYSDDVHKLAEDANDVLSKNLSALAHTVSYTLYLGIVVIAILPVAWFFSFRSIRRWRKELEKARKTLLANEKELQRFIGEIEMSQTEAIKARQSAENDARTVALLSSIAATANKVSNISEAIEIVLKLMCDYMGCQVGHAYALDAKDNLLRSAKLWYLKNRKTYGNLIEVSEATTFKRGEGLPGRVWETLSPVWVTDLTNDANFPRLKKNPNLGVKSGLAFPLIADSDVAYVLEFFFSEATKSNDEFLYIAQEVGNQLVRVIERTRAEEMLKLAKEEAEKSNASKSEFLANMSHELRTPLNSILGMLRLLKEGKLDGEELNLADTAFRSSTNLLEIVNDILDLSKIEAGEMQLERIGMDVEYALDSVILTLGHIAKEKRITLARQQEGEKLPYVLGDPTRFIRVLTNLVGNAIKYTEKGGVDLHASFKKTDDTHIEFRCAVKDTGIGIPKEKQKSVFEKFIQADTSTTRKYGGTGLGLAITKQLVELMNGTIGVESEVGIGSTFWFTVPFEITDKLNEEKSTRKKRMLSGTIPPDKARVLVAEDHPMNQMLMTKLLNRFGITSFEMVENGALALRRYQEAPWDVILMDCHMPEKNGYDTTIDIRKIEAATKAHVPIVAMTANAMIGDKEKCMRVGMDEYISKPINIDELKEVLGQWIAFPDLAKNEKDEKPAGADASVDLSILKTFSEGDIDLEKKFIGIFIEQSNKNIKTLAENRANADTKPWHDAAHMFKGGSSSIGANTLAALCNQAEHFEGTMQEKAALFEKIESEYIRVQAHLKKTGYLA